MSKPSQCVGCPLYDAEGPVNATGPSNAKVAVVGEAPSRDEITIGKPWSGGAGRYLNAQLERCGLSRFNIIVTNLVLCRPPNDRAPTHAEIAHCTRAYLHDTIRNVRVVGAMGGASCKHFTGSEGISAARGYIYEWSAGGGVGSGSGGVGSTKRVVPIFDPAAILRNTVPSSVFINDLNKIARLSHNEANTLHPPELVPLENVAQRALQLGYFTLDIETNGLDYYSCYVTAIGVGHRDAVCVLTPPYTIAQIQLLGALLRNKELRKRGHNLQFDITTLRTLGFDVQGTFEDTIQLHHSAFAELTHRLEHVAPMYLDLSAWKHMRRSNREEVK